MDIQKRAEWRQRQCATLLRIMHVHIAVQGPVPAAGMLVANHVGYVDVLVLGALMPAIFVSKAEVARWPVVGALTRAAGTLYVDRGSIRSAAQVSHRMAEHLRQGRSVIAFPEGTSSSGRQVLPFQPPLFEAALRSGANLFAAALHYNVGSRQGSASAAVPAATADATNCIAYWGDMTLGPHLFGVLCQRSVQATVCFSDGAVRGGCRQQLARAAHDAVVAIHARLSRPGETPHASTQRSDGESSV